MKNLFIISFMVLVSGLFLNCRETPVYGMPYQNYEMADLDSLDLRNIQTKIYDTFVQSMVSKKDDELKSVGAGLAAMAERHKNPLIKYWQGYLQYYAAIFYIQKEDKKASEIEINKGIEFMESIKNKNSEDLALLAMLQSFAIQFKKGMQAGIASGRVKKNVTQALALDDKNIRAYFVAGSNDFYTPEKYGGGKKVVEYLTTAVGLPSQQVPNEYLPSWGKETSYEMLIKVFIKREQWEEAKKYYQMAVKEYPKSYTINGLAPKLVGK